MNVAGRLRPGRTRYARPRPAGRAPAPVSEIVLRVVPVGPGHVEGPVPDPPPGVTAGGDFGDIIVRHVEVCDEAVAVGHLAVGPGGAERIGAVAQRQVGHPTAPVVAFARTPACGPADPLRHRAL